MSTGPVVSGTPTGMHCSRVGRVMYSLHFCILEMFPFLKKFSLFYFFKEIVCVTANTGEVVGAALVRGGVTRVTREDKHLCGQDRTLWPPTRSSLGTQGKPAAPDTETRGPVCSRRKRQRVIPGNDRHKHVNLWYFSCFSVSPPFHVQRFPPRAPSSPLLAPFTSWSS